MKKTLIILTLLTALATGCNQEKKADAATQESEVPGVGSAETLPGGSPGTSHFKEMTRPLARFPWDKIKKIEAAGSPGYMYLSHDIQDIVFLEEDELDAEEHVVYRNYLNYPTSGLFGYGMPMEFGYFVVPEGKIPFGMWYKPEGKNFPISTKTLDKPSPEKIELVIPYYAKHLYLFGIDMVETPNNSYFEYKEGYLGESIFTSDRKSFGSGHYLLLTAK